MQIDIVGGSPERFGYEWAKYATIAPEYEEQFRRWLPFFTKGDWEGKAFLDVGCGMGRNSYWPLSYGAAKGYSIDVDDRSLASAKRTLADFSNVEITKCSAYDIPWQDEVDIAFSIGVIHHLEFPERALEAMTRAAKPGGQVAMWVYGKENNGWLLWALNPARKILFSRMPISWVHFLAVFPTALLWVALKLGLANIEYFRLLKTFTFPHLRSIVFDQLLPRIANYWTEAEVTKLMQDAGLQNIETAWVNEMSWAARGYKAPVEMKKGWTDRVSGMSKYFASLAIGLVFAVVVIIQCSMHLGTTNVGRPYETWDEIANFNTSYVVNDVSNPLRTYRYGTLGTFIQWSGVAMYEWLDPIGPTVQNIRYANGVPQSLDDPYVMFARNKSWAGMDYNYFRGVDDHQPLFLSRKLHLLTAYLVILATGFLALAAYGRSAVFVLAPLLLLSVTPEGYFQMAQSLPNGVNMLLTFGAVLFAMTFCYRLQARWLIVSAVYLALALNFKTDAILISSALIIAVGLSWGQAGWRFALGSALKAFGVCVATFILTRPPFLLAPKQDLIIAYSILRDAGTLGNPLGFLQAIVQNLGKLGEFLAKSLFWPGANGWIALIVVVLVGIGLAFVLMRDMITRRSLDKVAAPLVGFALAGLLWSAIVIKGVGIADRYFLNGLAACLATVAVASLILARTHSKARIAAVAVLAAVSVSYIGHAVWQSRVSVEANAKVAAFGGFDPAHHRNQASVEAAKLAGSNGYARTVLVDQHSYTDLRILRLAGVEARYVNMLHLDKTTAELPAGRYLTIVTRGDYNKPKDSRGNEDDWSPALRQAYDAYQARLLALPDLRHYAGPAQLVLSFAPVNADDDLYLSVLTVP